MRLVAMLGLLLFASVAQAEPEMPAPVSAQLIPGDVLAIPGFAGPDGDALAGVVGSDLSHIGFFREVRHGTGVGPANDIDRLPDFTAWSAAGVRYLMVGAATNQPDSRMRVQVRLFDVLMQTQVLGRQFYSRSENRRRISHLISNAVAQVGTSKPGYFDSRIAFISESPSGTTRLAVMDQDGANPVFITTGKYRAADPSIYSGFVIAYTAEREGRPQAFLFALESGKQKPIGNLPGPSRMPAFSPDGRTIALICEANGHADICLIETTTDPLIRTLSHQATDASPNFSPDGKCLVFESDIGGAKGVFVTDIAGTQVRRLGGGGEKLGTPAWSPDGTKIAVTRFTQGGSHIAIMDADGSNLHDVSAGVADSRPAWAPNGEALLFGRTANASHQLWIVNIDGQNEHLVPASDSVSEASWSGISN